MSTFRFRLERVLELRRTELELEEARFKQAAAVVAELDRARAAVHAAGVEAGRQVRVWQPLLGADLAALDRFQDAAALQERRIATRRAEAARQVAEQQGRMLEARRRCRLLERLRERRLAGWKAEQDRQIEESAAERFLARWKPGRKA